MLAGVAIADPGSTWIEPDVELEPDAAIHPFTLLRGATKVAAGAEVGPHVVAIDAEIGPEATVGPFCYLRPGTVLGPRTKAGAFVEIKKSTIGQDTKVPHLSYIGDAEIGEDTNIGAGSITANFPHRPGQPKGKTTIGSNVRVAVDTMFVAPVTVGDDAWTAAGPSSPTTSRTTRSQASRPGRSTRKDAVESGTIEQTLPGLEGAGSDGAAARWSGGPCR